MKLSSLYSNQPKLFPPVTFRSGLNVVYADIRLPENRDADTHNLGKSTFGRVIGFCLLDTINKTHFFKQRDDLFGNFVFFLEIELASGEFLTIRRSIAESSKASFKRYPFGKQDFSAFGEKEWDHWSIAADKSRTLLDGYLDFTEYKPWNYRKGIGYQLRSQIDYSDVFQIDRYARGLHGEWKPFMTKILGLDFKSVERQYSIQSDIEKISLSINNLRSEAGGGILDSGAIEGLLQLKTEEIRELEESLESFNFEKADQKQTRDLVDELDTRIASLNERRYTSLVYLERIEESTTVSRIRFDVSEVKALYQDAGIQFSGQLARTFEDLVSFNRAITEERIAHLASQARSLREEVDHLGEELTELSAERAEYLSFLGSTDAFEKYKSLNRSLVKKRADIETLKRRRRMAESLIALEQKLAELQVEQELVNRSVNANVRGSVDFESGSLFSNIRSEFSHIVNAVINRKALLNIRTNKEGFVEFEAFLVDEQDQPNFAHVGHTYKKFLCIAYDLAMTRVHKSPGFPKFVFHDGIFETVDPRKKTQLINLIRNYETLGVQHIITMLDSDDPGYVRGHPEIKDDEIILRLHDEGEDGRLFKMPSW